MKGFRALVLSTGAPKRTFAVTVTAITGMSVRKYSEAGDGGKCLKSTGSLLPGKAINKF